MLGLLHQLQHQHHYNPQQVNRRYENSGQAPLHIAASNGSINAIAALITAGARLEVGNLLIINIIIIMKIYRRLIACDRQRCITASPPPAALRRPKLF